MFDIQLKGHSPNKLNQSEINIIQVSLAYLGHKRGSLQMAFLAATMKTGTKNRCVIEATHVLQRKLKKD